MVSMLQRYSPKAFPVACIPLTSVLLLQRPFAVIVAIAALLAVSGVTSATQVYRLARIVICVLLLLHVRLQCDSFE